jgi:large subunit ribosomal protein L9
MRVLLRKDVSGLGRRGDVVDVARGYARNYLFPAGRAVEASAGMQSQAASMRRARDIRDTKEHEGAQAVAALLAGVTLTVPARAGSGGRLFGSVTSAEIAQALEAQTGAVVDRRRVHLDEPIKSLGAHVVPIRLHADVSVELNVDVVAAG